MEVDGKQEADQAMGQPAFPSSCAKGEASGAVLPAVGENAVQEGSSVLLDVNGDKQSFIVVKKSTRFKVGKAFCSLAPLIGAPFGSVFELQGGQNTAKLVRVDGNAASLLMLENGSIAPEEDGGGAPKKEEVAKSEDESQAQERRDNRSLVDDNTAQALTAAHIEEMRRQGKSGKEIMEALVANSATFASKTEYSQEKYMRKKQKKYAPRVIVRRPSARSVCEAYFTKSPAKTGFLRMDALSLLLSMANVGAHASVLCLDNCGGLLTAAVAERLGGHGTVCSAYCGSRAWSIDICTLFNFSEAAASAVLQAPLSELLYAHQKLSKPSDQPASLNPTPSTTTSQEAAPNPAPPKAPEESRSSEVEPLESLQPDKDPQGTGEAIGVPRDKGGGSNPKPKPRAGKAARKEQVETWARTGFSSLLMAAPAIQPLAALQQLLPLMAPSSPFAVYSTSLQPLAECMQWLQTSRKAVAVQLLEPWLREYQVLPNRTHPQMQMSATGGYILYGIVAVGERVGLQVGEAAVDNGREEQNKKARTK